MDFERWEQDNAESDILDELINSGELEGAALGVARQVQGQGEDSLRGRQVYVFEQIQRNYFHPDCARCHLPIPQCEVAGMLQNGDGLCGWCAHQKGKLDRE